MPRNSKGLAPKKLYRLERYRTMRNRIRVRLDALNIYPPSDTRDSMTDKALDCIMKDIDTFIKLIDKQHTEQNTPL